MQFKKVMGLIDSVAAAGGKIEVGGKRIGDRGLVAVSVWEVKMKIYSPRSSNLGHTIMKARKERGERSC